MENEIKEGNKLIAEFMGKRFLLLFNNKGGIATPEISEADKYFKLGYTFKNSYHNDWSLLMPVVEKINKDYGWSFGINDEETWFADDKTTLEYSGKEPIENTLNAVIKFIKYRNTNT